MMHYGYIRNEQCIQQTGWFASVSGMPALLLFKILSTSFPMSVFHIVFSIVAIDLFDMGTQQLGFLMSFMGITLALSQGFLIGWIIDKCGETSVLWISSTFLAVSMLAFSACSQIWQVEPRTFFYDYKNGSHCLFFQKKCSSSRRRRKEVCLSAF